MRQHAAFDMADTATVKDVSTRALSRQIVSLAGPTMLEQLLQSAVNYIDTAMVGSIGTMATAAVGSTSTVNWLIFGSINALGIGFLSYISQAFGAREYGRAKRASMQSVFVAFFAGIFFTVLTMALGRKVPELLRVDENIREKAADYFLIFSMATLPRAVSLIFASNLRAAGDAKTPLKISVVVNILNVIGNYFLIYETRDVSLFGLVMRMPGAGWGVEGAAVATSVSVFIGGILFFIVYMRHPLISPKGAPFKLEKEIIKPCLRVSFPNLIQRFCTSFGYVVFASMINSLGEISTAAHTVANTVESAFYIPGFGMQAAAATLSGNVIGARDRKRQKLLSKQIRIFEVVLMFITGGLLFVTAPLLVSIFSSDDEVIRLGSTVLRMVAVSEPIYGICIATEGMLHGAGKTTFALFANIGCMWGIRIFGTFIFTQLLDYGLIAAWGSMIAHNVVLCILFTIYFERGKWNPLAKIIEENDEKVCASGEV